MNKKVVSQEMLTVALGGTLLATLGAAAVKAITSKLTEETATKAVSTAKDMLAARQSGDLVRFTQSARVEPIMLMDKRAVNIPFIQDVVHTAYNMFTGYWLLAVSLDAKINGVAVGRRLDKFATDRDLNEATMTMLSSSMESMSESFGLPFIDEILAEQASMESVTDDAMVAASIVADIDSIEDETKRENLRKEFERMEESANKRADGRLSAAEAKLEAEFKAKLEEAKGRGKSGSSVNNAAKYVEKINNLAVGNVIDVTISEDGKEAVIPVTIRLRVAGMPSDVMTETLAVGGRDATFRSRWRAWRAGEIKFWADFVLAMDRVDAHRAAMMKDETGYYKTVYGRAAKNNMAATLAGGPSLATASSIVVMDIKTARELERRISGSLENFKTRQGIFGHTFSMLMIIVDPDWESVTIYTRGIEMPTKLTKNDIKSAGKSDSKELMDILKSYQLGKAPGRI